MGGDLNQTRSNKGGGESKFLFFSDVIIEFPPSSFFQAKNDKNDSMGNWP